MENELNGYEDCDDGIGNCPICGAVVYDDNSIIEEVCEHVLMIYSDWADCISYYTPKMKSVVNMIKVKAEDGCINDLMEEYAKKNRYEIFEHNINRLCCGDRSGTDYYMIGKLNVKKAKK